MSTFVKDKDAVLDWQFDWSAWLEEGEIIDTSTVTGTGIAVDSNSIVEGKVVTAWLSGGEAAKTSVVCKIVTSQGRTDERTITISIRER